MSIFSLENDISSCTRMDAPLNVGRGLPSARWSKSQQQQRKASSSGVDALTASTSSASNSSLNVAPSGNSSDNIINSSIRLNSSLKQCAAGGVAGSKRLSESLRKTPSKTPKNSPGRVGGGTSTTPGRKTPGGGDRFISNRAATDFENGRYRLLHGDLTDSDTQMMSPSKRKYQRFLTENLGDPDKTRIIAYAQKAPQAPESHSNGLKVLYNPTGAKTPGSTVKKTARHIPQVPERILDAPQIVNDYYLNLIDWSSNNLLAVALGAHVYLWNAASGEIQQLLGLESPEDYVCSVKWIREGNILSVGNSLGELALWDVESMKRVRVMRGHSDRIGCLSWNQHILTSGSRSGRIIHSDVRVADHLVAELSQGHTQEVCGLAWSPDGRLLASGGNDNTLNIWSAVQGECYTQAAPKYTFTQHQAAVKALSWCPWQPGVLASGGGTADRCIRIWNCNNGTLLNTVDTKSQVCSLLWSPEYKELISSHGFANNEVTLWKYPSMVKTAELMGHTERVLHMAMSPDGTTLVSAGADETLRLWKCFLPDPAKKKMEGKTKTKTSQLISRAGIR